MTPINYTAMQVNPADALMQGVKTGMTLDAIGMEKQQQQATLQAQQQAQEGQRALQMVLSNPNATVQDYGAVSAINPKFRESIKEQWDRLDTSRQQTLMGDASKLFSALQSGRSDIALETVETQLKAAENSGDKQRAGQIKAYRDMIQQAPDYARTMIGASIAAVPGGEKYFTSIKTMGEEGRASALSPAELKIKNAEAGIKGAEAKYADSKIRGDIANVQSQIADRANRFALDTDKLTTETQIKLQELQQKAGELPDDVRKDLNSAVTDSIAAQNSSAKMFSLADRLEKENGSFGAHGRFDEWIKNATGNQNELTRLRAEYNRIATPTAMAAYKKVASGSTSDKDIETAMTGVPKATDDAETVAAFLRGAAKLQVYDSVLQNAKSEWLGAVKGLNKTSRDIEIDGVRVPAGTTFKQFSDQYTEKKVADQLAASLIPTRSYMRYATPEAAPANGTTGSY